MSGSIRNLEREYSCTVRLLDDTEYTCTIQVSHLSTPTPPYTHSSTHSDAMVYDLAEDVPLLVSTGRQCMDRIMRSLYL